MVKPKSSAAIIAGGGTKQAIRDAAVRLFSSKGFDQTSLREVADAVGITKPSLYYHYASKLDLLNAIIDPVIDHVSALCERLDSTAYEPAGIREVLETYLRGLLENRDAGALFVRDTVTILNALADRHTEVRANHDRLRTWLAGPDPSPQTCLRAGAALEVLSMAMVSMEVSPTATDEVVAETLLDAALTVLLPRSA